MLVRQVHLDAGKRHLVGDGKDYGFHQLLDLLVQAADVAVVLRRLLVHLHRLHARIVLRWERIQDQIRILQCI